MEKWSKIFSYLGNDANPPDIMLKNGDAIEVKKIRAEGAALALNSSSPKKFLSATLENREQLFDIQKNYSKLKISDVKIKNPDNPAKLKNAKLITYEV